MADAYGGTRKRLRGSEHLKDQEEEAAQKLQFLEPAVQGIYDGTPIDVDVVANDGRTFKAHRDVMETRSPLFRAMFKADRIKEAAYAWQATKSPMFQAIFEAGQTIVSLTEPVKFPDLNHEQLKCLLEFLYSAHIPHEKLAQHSHALLIAAHKYDIITLGEKCEAYISSTVSPANFVEILEQLATLCSGTTLKDIAISVMLPRFAEVAFSKEYEDFSVKNAHLALEITKAFVRLQYS